MKQNQKLRNEFPIEYNDYRELFIEEAENVVESLTTLPFILHDVKIDQTTSYIDDGLNIEEESRKINRIKYIFVPILDGIPMAFNKIVIDYDAKGLYAIRSNAPYSAKEIGSVELKPKEDILYGVEAAIDQNGCEFDKSSVVYIIDKNNTARVKYVYLNKEESSINGISMEDIK